MRLIQAIQGIKPVNTLGAVPPKKTHAELELIYGPADMPDWITSYGSCAEATYTNPDRTNRFEFRRSSSHSGTAFNAPSYITRSKIKGLLYPDVSDGGDCSWMFGNYVTAAFYPTYVRIGATKHNVTLDGTKKIEFTFENLSGGDVAYALWIDEVLQISSSWTPQGQMGDNKCYLYSYPAAVYDWHYFYNVQLWGSPN